MRKRTRKQTRDINQFAADVVRRSTGTGPAVPNEAALSQVMAPVGRKRSQMPVMPSAKVVSQIMAAMGRKGGLKGAATLNARLSPAQRKASARRAAQARWGKKA
jgi:hypothetical protein